MHEKKFEQQKPQEVCSFTWVSELFSTVFCNLGHSSIPEVNETINIDNGIPTEIDEVTKNLFKAVLCKNSTIMNIKLLIDTGAKVKTRDVSGKSILYLAAKNIKDNQQFKDVAKLLIANGADLDADIRFSMPIISYNPTTNKNVSTGDCKVYLRLQELAGDLIRDKMIKMAEKEINRRNPGNFIK